MTEYEEKIAMLADIRAVMVRDTMIDCVREDLVALVHGLYALGYRREARND